MKKIGGGLLFLGIAALIFTACAPKATPAPPAPSPTPPVLSQLPKAPQKEGWEEEWDRAVAAAKREGRIVIYTSVSAEPRIALSKAFAERFGVSVEFVAGRSAELVEKLLSERRAGLRLVDLYLSGSTTAMTTLKPGGVLVPLESTLLLPEVKDPKVWWGNELLWADKGHYMLAFLAFPSGKVGINTNLVKPGEIKSWRDLLDARWKGKMTLNDPTVSGSGHKWFQAMVEGIMGVDYMRELAKQEPMVMRDQRMQVDWLAKAKYPIGISVQEDIVSEFLRAGAPVTAISPQEGGYVTMGSGGIALVDRAPHPNATKVFINWLLTREVQTIYSRIYGSQSARTDVPTDFLNPWSVRESGLKYFCVINEEFDLRAAEHLRLAKEIFTPSAK